MSDEVPTLIEVQIMESDYRVACPPSQVEELRAAAAYLNDKVHEIRISARVSDTERIAVMAGLNIAYELLVCRRELEALSGIGASRTQELLAKIDAALGKLVQSAV